MLFWRIKNKYLSNQLLNHLGITKILNYKGRNQIFIIHEKDLVLERFHKDFRDILAYKMG